MNKQTSEKGGPWWAGYDGDTFTSGPHDTREQAIFAGREEFDGSGFYVIEAATMPIKFSVSRLLDDQYFDCDDYWSDEGGEPDRCGNHAAADAELQELLDAWLVRHRDTFVDPGVFAWTRNRAFIAAGAVGEQEAA